MDAACQPAELRDRLLDLVLLPGERIGSGRINPRRFETERDGKRHEALLRAVVQVALDTATLGVTGGDDPAARGTNLRELGSHHGGEALVLEHDRRGCAGPTPRAPGRRLRRSAAVCIRSAP